jgi:hypothetical protein
MFINFDKIDLKIAATGQSKKINVLNRL